MKIPKSVTIGGVKYSIEECELVHGGCWLGSHLASKALIKIANKAINPEDDDDCLYDIPQTQREQTFVHELTHAILSTMGNEDLNQNEEFVSTFSSFLNEALNTIEY